MTRRYQILFALLLLPCMLARSVLPTGFMWGSGADSARIVFCPDQSLVALRATAQQGHAHAHHHDGQQQDHQDHDSRAHAGSQCPFAIAAVAALPTFVAGLATFAIVRFHGIATPSAPATGGDVVRDHPIRGPPALS